MNDPLKEDLKRYAAEVGPEPIVNGRSPDVVAQVKRWEAWWLEWYRRPLQPGPSDG